MKNIFLFIKFIIYFLVFCGLLSCSNKNTTKGLTDFQNKPIYENPESSIEGFLIDILVDKMIYHYYSLPEEGITKHNSTIFLALSEPNHGKVFGWDSGKYYGLVKMIETIKENEKLCRSWIEEVGKITPFDNYGIKNQGLVKVSKKIGSNKACFNLLTGNWVIVDKNFHFNN